MADTMWSLYIVRNRLGSLYTGITTNVERRFQQHQNGTGAKALKGKGPLLLEFHCQVGDRQRASQLEYQLKQLKKTQKEKLITDQPSDIALYLIQDK
ncbi:GIY-YIG nuclease family protein [Proteus vulgaris]|uniref:GIY-YIG nuclease family protein n=1 Tax=Proteus TaxID=583 RepID=UPI000D698489|nr:MULTISPECIES: GIY-YIG nuclease family protein [Proteus]MBQ0213114.1 GIY-YIG nuclease family protein [Proteus vulgaris]MDS0788266.1 GIY-YIG nuclease family protein [Proteus vulgaris]NBM55324.1 GIY-YIG nuclease family protein [Proteus sp. G2669]UDN36378.1 GIY-YIG nuclease family protein [Proteus sp. NMG38-2]UPK81419.1 GIY-YIG nuclease family protein [Proteus vulgaris]